MELIVSRVDLRKTRENWPAELPFKPALVLKQPVMHPSDWQILDAPLQAGSPPSWASAKQDQYVYIPLFEYRLSPEADLALAGMVHLGLACAGSFSRPVRKLHLAVGNPVDLLYEEDITSCAGLAYWFGFAVVLT